MIRKLLSSPWVGNTLMVLFAVLCAGLLCEVVLRFTDYRYLLNRSFGFPQGYFVPDKELGTDYPPNFPPRIHEFYGPTYEVFTNSLGCFDWERPVEKDYALLLGGSSAWGYAPLEQMWSSVLEKKLGWQILKCAVAGSGTREQLIKARRIVDKIGHYPKIILVLYDGPTDVNDDYLLPITTTVNGCRVENLDYVDLKTGKIRRLTPEETEGKYRRKSHCDTVKSNTAWGKFRKYFAKLLMVRLFKEFVVPRFRREVRKATHDDDKIRSKYDKIIFNLYDPKVPWMVKALESHKKNLRDLLAFAHAGGAKVVILDENVDLKLDIMADVFREIQRRGYYYDLKSAIAPYDKADRNKYRWRFDPHWNKEGNRLAADLIYEYMRQAELARPLSQIK